MNVPLIKRLNSFLDRHRLWILKDIALFVVILFGFHFFYNILLRPLITMDGYNFVWIYLQQLLYRHSTWVMEHIFGWAFMREGYHIVFPGHGSIIVDESCSATKWLLHFLVLMLIFPGPWKHKLWFIPLGLIVVHLISISRIVGLSAVFRYNPESFDFFHDYVFRPFFYSMLFLIWVIWLEVFLPLSSKSGYSGDIDPPFRAY
jgi:exosortase/archaeosortase family protein